MTPDARAEALIGTCLEFPQGAVLAVDLFGHRLERHLGARFAPPPVVYHAWADLPDHARPGDVSGLGSRARRHAGTLSVITPAP